LARVDLGVGEERVGSARSEETVIIGSLRRRSGGRSTARQVSWAPARQWRTASSSATAKCEEVIAGAAG